MKPEVLRDKLSSLIAIVDMRLHGMIGNPDNTEPLSRADNTTEEQEAQMKNTIKKSAKKIVKKSKPETMGKVSKKKSRDLEEEDEEDDDVDADDDEDEVDDEDESDDDEDGDDDDSDEDEDGDDDEDGDESDDDEDGDDDDSDEDEDGDSEDDEDGDDDDSDEDGDESEDDDSEEEDETPAVSPKLKKGEYTITKNDFTFEVVEGKSGYKKGDQIEIKRATQASYDKTTVFEVSGAKDTAKRQWVVLSAKRKHLVVPVEFVLNSKGKPAELLEAEEAPAKSKKSAKAEKPAKKGAKVEASTGSNKKAIKRIDAIIAELVELKDSL